MPPLTVDRVRMTRAEFYRLCRDWHGYLSAFAFLALLFFAATGILLNHPEWLAGPSPEPVETAFALSAEETASITAAADPARRLTEIAASHADLAGAFRDGELVGADVFARLQGVSGLTDVRANLETGEGSAFVERAPPLTVLNELHRGEHAGHLWRLAIDIMGGVLIALSLLGYLIFLSLRFRVRTALVLTAASFILFGGMFVLVVT